jgi:hypothetical protein
MAAKSGADVHHGATRLLLGLFDAAAAGIADWSEFDSEAERLSIEVCGLSCEELRAIIESSTFEIPTPEHRRLHQEASAFVWWGRRGGLRILALYGRPYFSLLARFRWGQVPIRGPYPAPCREAKGGGSLRPAPVGEGHPLRPRGLRAVFGRRARRPRELRGGDRQGRRQHTGLSRRKWLGSTAPGRTDEGRKRIRDVRDRCVR